jgi:hypothetical protein
MSKIIKKISKKTNVNANTVETYSLNKKFVYTNYPDMSLEPLIKSSDHNDSINTENTSNYVKPSELFSLVRNHRFMSKL